jgi:NADPH:quinone reductase-like Zn-dependent oxidoreductase
MAIGARTIGTSRTKDKLAPATALGLVVGLAVTNGSFADAVRDATKGHGADLVLELVGGSYVAEDLQATAQRGRIIIVGLTGGFQGDLNLGVILRKRLMILGTQMRSRPLAEKIAAAQVLECNIVPLIERGLVKPCVHAVLPLAKAREAHTRVGANEGVGKFVLEI